MSEALNVVACVEMNTKFFREENFHAVGCAFHLLQKKLRSFRRKSPGIPQIGDVLIRAGATTSLASLAPIAAKGGFIRFLVYEDGSLGHEFLERVVKP